MADILVLNGPNLNLLGSREPALYGTRTLEQIGQDLVRLADDEGLQLENFQSNAEHQLIERIHQASRDGVRFVIFNPAAFTHTSVALRDALLCVAIPFIEVHLSNIHGREPFRHHSYFSDIARGVITGLGPDSYRLAVSAAITALGSQ